MVNATDDDLYGALSYKVWKTGPCMCRELEEQGKSAEALSYQMYVYLDTWEDEGLIRSRPCPLTEDQKAMGLRTPQTEYIRISTGVPEKILGLEGKLKLSKA